MAKVMSPPAMLKGLVRLGNHGPRCPVTRSTAGALLLLRDRLIPSAVLTGWQGCALSGQMVRPVRLG